MALDPSFGMYIGYKNLKASLSAREYLAVAAVATLCVLFRDPSSGMYIGLSH